MKVQYIRRGRNQQFLFQKMVLVIFIAALLIKLLQSIVITSGVQVEQPMVYNATNANISLYKIAIESTIPGFKQGSVDKENLGIFDIVTEILFDFNFNNESSMLASTLPLIGYVEEQYALQNGYSSEVTPVMAEKESIIDEDNPQYFNGIKQDEIVTVFNGDITDSVPVNFTQEQLHDLDFLFKNFYCLQSGYFDVSLDDFDIDYFLSKDTTIDVNSREPKVLIMHTHSQETFIDSRPGVEEDTVVGIGATLANILRNKYGINVIHDKTKYDMNKGVVDHGTSYDRVDKQLPLLLEQYPSVEVVIDLHRDGIGDEYHLVTDLNDKPTSQLMFVNGICKLKGPDGVTRSITSLPNDNLKDNMAFSLQMQLKAMELYPDLTPSLTRKIYIKPYRYSTYLKPNSLLVEVGAQNSTIQEAKNAMEPLAKILYEVLTGQ